MKSLIWLASYPRSGNTWLRMFLANWIANRDEPVSINELERYGMAFQDNDPDLWKQVCGVAVPDEDTQIARRVDVQRALPQWARARYGGSGEHFFVKTHCFHGAIDDHPTIAEDMSHKAIYIVRDPRQVAASLSAFHPMPAEQVVDLMNDPDAKLGGKKAFQFLATWSQHVASWSKTALRLDYRALPGDFAKVIWHLGWSPDPVRLARAIEFSSLERLVTEEREGKFSEARETRFFGATTDALSPELCQRIERDHGDVMRYLRYLP
jgi:hypothetical protein